jgi:hypothetical protein
MLLVNYSAGFQRSITQKFAFNWTKFSKFSLDIKLLYCSFKARPFIISCLVQTPCRNALYKRPLQTPCINSLYKHRVQMPCTHSLTYVLYILHVKTPCTNALYVFPVKPPCTNFLYKRPVQMPCTTHYTNVLYVLLVQMACTYSMYKQISGRWSM